MMAGWRDNFQDILELDEANNGLTVNGRQVSLQGELTEYGLEYFLQQLRFAEEAIAQINDHIRVFKWSVTPEAAGSPEDKAQDEIFLAKSERELAAMLEYRDFVQEYVTRKQVASSRVYET